MEDYHNVLKSAKDSFLAQYPTITEEEYDVYINVLYKMYKQVKLNQETTDLRMQANG